MHLFGMLFLPYMAFGLLLSVFWIWMLIDAIQNQEEDKAMWVILVAFLHFVGALLYYFIPRDKRKKSEHQKTNLK